VKTKPVKVGIVGLGRWAKVLARAAANSQEIEIVADYSRSEEKRHVFEQELGVSMNYAYDAASQLTGITYTLGSNTLGNLTYAYDLAGRRTGVGGSYARTNAPLAASSATYNVNNQLTQWKGASLTYDANGNLTGATTTNSFAYTGRELDPTGLDFFRARYYNPTLQRFISKDPIGFSGGDVDLYAYASNSPTNFIDPSGKSNP